MFDNLSTRLRVILKIYFYMQRGTGYILAAARAAGLDPRRGIRDPPAGAGEGRKFRKYKKKPFSKISQK